MHPELLSYPHISSYRAFLLLGFLAGFIVVRWLAKHRGLPVRHVDNLTLILVLITPIGARWFSRLFYMPSVSFVESFRVWEGGGLVFYGGFAFGVAALFGYSRLQRLKGRMLLDIFAPGLALGMAFGRIGCFMAGCCWGDLCVSSERLTKMEESLLRGQVYTLPTISKEGFPFAVRFPVRSAAFEQHQKLGLIEPASERSLPVHPVQLYEAALVFALSLALVAASRRRSSYPDGLIFGFMMLGYACIRFVIEFLRADNQPIYWGMTLSQSISLALVGLGALLILPRVLRGPILTRLKTRSSPIAIR